jgi:hypothetical protein
MSLVIVERVPDDQNGSVPWPFCHRYKEACLGASKFQHGRQKQTSAPEGLMLLEDLVPFQNSHSVRLGGPTSL